ncbi:MAG: hypothetical protein WBV23_05920, partial [Desulfobaccales bacterium]
FVRGSLHHRGGMGPVPGFAFGAEKLMRVGAAPEHAGRVTVLAAVGLLAHHRGRWWTVTPGQAH